MDAKLETLQRVVEEVTSWQESATEGTIATELDRGLDDAGITVADDARARLVDAIDGADAQVDVTAIVSADDIGTSGS